VNFEYFNRAMVVRGTPFGLTPFGGMLMRVRFHHREFGVSTPARCREVLNRRLFYRMLSIPRLCLFTTCDELLLKCVGRARPEYTSKLAYVPELSTVHIRSSIECARRALGIAPDRFVVLAYGALSMRKGIRELLAAAAHPSFPANAMVLLAGALGEDLWPLMKGGAVEGLRRAGRLRELGGFLDNTTEHDVFRAADIVWLGYRGQYESSAVLVQAASMGLPVVACDEGLIAWWTRNHGIGEIVQVADTGSVAGAFSRLASDRALRERYAARGLAISSRHSPGAFSAAICDAIARASKGARPVPRDVIRECAEVK
jgi:glycosyltransferase involved in cell wall biosynthesis